MVIVSNLSQPSLPNSAIQRGQTTEQQFLKFYLHPDTKAMLPIKQITEVLKISFGQIVPLPHLPAWVMGVYNWRGNILWMVDLGHLIGLDSWYQHQVNRSYHTAIVLSPHKEAQSNTTVDLHLGLVVSRVEDIEICNITEIQAAPNFSITDRLADFSQGYWLEPEGEMVLVFDGQAIAAAMPD
ncbi:purine-binding chemotaxis protein CheW [Pleurocapsales cyanobacterium LEGE 10410]|nr:purine-binding chemotaxis protein CheW [Pleurocapsales cyanobacterium LEGE 10410]